MKVDWPDPVVDESSEPYWEFLKQGEMRIQRCESCGHRQFYPRRFCLRCRSDRLDWLSVSGWGVIHTFSVVHKTADAAFSGQAPYVLAIVELEEGVRFTTRIVDADAQEIVCGMNVQIGVVTNKQGYAFPVARIVDHSERRA